jgi:hypothetical protein
MSKIVETKQNEDIEVHVNDSGSPKKNAKFDSSGGIVIGSDSTESNNVKLHRGGVGALEVVQGDDTTTEGTSSPNQATLGANKLKIDIGELTRNSSTGKLEYSPDGVSAPVGLGDGSLGDVRSSLLTEPQFQAINGTNWVLMDGSSVAGSDFATLTGITTLPDARGEFLRGLDNGRGVDPARTMASAQGEATAAPTIPFTGSISGSTNNTGSHAHSGAWSPGGPATPYGTGASTPPWNNTGTSSAGDHAHTVSGSASITGGGDSETRPRNIAVNYFIKINN